MEIKLNTVTGDTEFTTYIGGDAYTAPVILRSDGTTLQYLYLHRDYQGSIVAITNQASSIVEKRLFDAWGEILKIQNGTDVNLNSFLVLDRGYTGHEHLQSVGLINMNARLYDPQLHRFLQPDNYVQDPTNTQSYNRYTYCWNNPLKYADYNGEYVFWDDLAAFVIGGVINWAVNGCQFNLQGLSYFGVGGASGLATIYGGPLAGAAVSGFGNDLVNQVAAKGWDGYDVKQGIGNTVMSVGMAYVGGQISQSFAPYLDKVTAVITSNSVLQGAIVNGLSTGISGFILNLSTSYLDNGNANDAFSNGLKGFAQGFTMGAGQSLVQSGYNYVKSRTVKSPINAIESKAEPTGKKDLVAQVQKGKDGEIAAGIDPNAPKEKIVVDSRTRIPDELDHKYKTLTEVKNVKSQSFTKQLRDFHQYSLDNGYKMILYMPEGHPVTKPLQQQFDNGTIIRLNLKF